MEQNKNMLNDKIFRFIYIIAMRDAIVQLAYNGEKKWLMENNMLNSLKAEVETFVNNTLNGKFKSQKEYDEEFLDITIRVCDVINKKANNNKFTFGNAQKFLNIMLKYFYISSYNNDKVKKYFRFCHCPMDQQLLKNVWYNRANLKSNNMLGKRDYFLKSWGNEEFVIDDNGKITYPERYLLFQKAVREIAMNTRNINPLEYDYYGW